MAYATSFNLARKERLLIFGVSENQNLNLRDVNINEDELTITTVSNTNELAQGIVCVPGSIVSLPYAGWTRTYGFVTFTDADKKETKQLSMISPVHSWLKRTTDAKFPALAGCSDGEDRAWLYYFNDSSLWEKSLKAGDPTEIATDTAFKQPSQLGATFGLDRRRYVAYQLKKNTIRVFYVENGSALPDLPNSTANALANTPLAIVQSEEGGKYYINVYYLNLNSVITRAKLDVATAGSDWVEDQIKSPDNAPATSTSLSAIWEPTSKRVILTHALKSGGVSSYFDQPKWNH